MTVFACFILYTYHIIHRLVLPPELILPPSGQTPGLPPLAPYPRPTRLADRALPPLPPRSRPRPYPPATPPSTPYPPQVRVYIDSHRVYTCGTTSLVTMQVLVKKACSSTSVVLTE